MGAFYVNYLVKGAIRQSILQAMTGRKAFVSPEENGCIVIYDEQSDAQDQNLIDKLAARLSYSLHSVVFAVLIHDSDIFWYRLYDNGKLADTYDSSPGYWSGNLTPPKGGDANRLCAIFRYDNPTHIEQILRASDDEYPDATNRHEALVEAFDLPSFSVSAGYQAIAEGYLPEGCSAEDFSATT